MSAEDRTKFLNEAPVGAKITGLYNKINGKALKVEKKSGGYGTGYLTSRKRTFWTINGIEEPHIGAALKKAANGKSRDYTTK